MGKKHEGLKFFVSDFTTSLNSRIIIILYLLPWQGNILLMDKSAIQKLIATAPTLLKGEVPKFPTRIERRALEVLRILKDNNWHTPSEIAGLLDVSKKYVGDILRAVEKPWNLETKREERNEEKYWKLPQSIEDGRSIMEEE